MKALKIFRLRRFGDPILRQKARQLAPAEIKSSEIQTLITDIRKTNEVKQYGVGLAAPQVGVSVALSIIGIKPTPTRPQAETFTAVIINPSYQGIGRRTGMWEGCQSSGTGNDTLYGKALRYRRIRARWLDENAEQHDEELTGLVAHVFQHETDHLQGILFVDRVRDTRTYMLASEYRKQNA
ncbi:MAG: peptide deformylase [Candidatus Saccharimonadales bacterium]